jgi:hypothetical protein
VLYLGEINDSQEAAWRKTVAVFDEQRQRFEQYSLFPSDWPIAPDEQAMWSTCNSPCPLSPRRASAPEKSNCRPLPRSPRRKRNADLGLSTPAHATANATRLPKLRKSG